MKDCFLHPGHAAYKSLNVPCAPGGKIWVCDNCNSDPDIAAKVWAKYKQGHADRIAMFKTPGNPKN